MRDLPVIFARPMVDALLREAIQPGSGKTQTRRLAWRWEDHGQCGAPDRPDDGRFGKHATSWQDVKPGDILWVKETHWRYGRWEQAGTNKKGNVKWRFRPYDAGVPQLVFDEPPRDKRAMTRTEMGYHQRPSFYMPRWANRLSLLVKATRIEPLHNISAKDAMAEGVVENTDGELRSYYLPGAREAGWKIGQATHPALLFKALWSELHGTDVWDANPDVVALSFNVYAENVDGMMKAAA